MSPVNLIYINFIGQGLVPRALFNLLRQAHCPSRDFALYPLKKEITYFKKNVNEEQGRN
jgi:hypothetical protein